MKIEFRTKEESNKAQREAFLALSPHERFMQFLELSRKIQRFNTKKQRPINPNNFIIERKSK
ncbi:MAG TPA: hypothetical protein PLP27_00070 [Crocinitomicaceae bacterium]|nr:hypothetical protein [Crocinitomicaceae bacterium]